MTSWSYWQRFRSLFYRRLCDGLPGRLRELCTGDCPSERPCRPQDIAEFHSSIWWTVWTDRRVRWYFFWLIQLQRIFAFWVAINRHARDWFRRVPQREYRRRVAVCQACPHYIAEYQGKPAGRCGKCGCAVEGRVLSKARWRSEDCPVCARCGLTRKGGCACEPFVSRWSQDGRPKVA